jgi:hypothetical protein
MSHTAKIQTEFTDKDCLKKACERLGIKFKDVQNERLYDGTTKSGMAIYLPNWRYPVIIDENNEAFYDNYNGSWGKIEEFHNLKTYYGVEKAKKLARVKGYSTREVMVEGRPQVRITVG